MACGRWITAQLVSLGTERFLFPLLFSFLSSISFPFLFNWKKISHPPFNRYLSRQVGWLTLLSDFIHRPLPSVVGGDGSGGVWILFFPNLKSPLISEHLSRRRLTVILLSLCRDPDDGQSRPGLYIDFAGVLDLSRRSFHFFKNKE